MRLQGQTAGWPAVVDVACGVSDACRTPPPRLSLCHVTRPPGPALTLFLAYVGFGFPGFDIQFTVLDLSSWGVGNLGLGWLGPLYWIGVQKWFCNLDTADCLNTYIPQSHLPASQYLTCQEYTAEMENNRWGQPPTHCSRQGHFWKLPPILCWFDGRLSTT